MAEHFGVTVSQGPAIRLAVEGQQSHAKLKGDVTAANVVQFLADYQAGNIKVRRNIVCA